MNAGYLIPDDKTLEIVSDYLGRPEYKSGYIVDGFPRTTGQAKAFKAEINHVIYLNVSDREALWRLSLRNDSVREDETLTAIRKRIDLFHKFTEPVLDYYRKRNLLIEIDGEQRIEDINREILKKIGR
jgi:adenylate kinase